MVNDSDIRVLHINAPEMALIRLMARAAMRGGKSYIRASSERRATLETDQLVGQLGTYAGHKFWFGHSYNYLVSRQQANLNPNTGDGGSDIVGANVDFKTSLIRSDRPLLDYRLVVRPIERKPAKVYVQLLADIQQNTANVYILGWADDAMLPEPEREGVFQGACVLQARKLHPLPPLQWLWVETAQHALESGVN